MTRIKCKYAIPYCEYHQRHERKRHSEYWWCDTDDECDVCAYTKPEGSTCFNPTCIYCEDVCGEFEKEVKSYEYHDGDLKIGRKVYYAHDITYLEIDGRVLVGAKHGRSLEYVKRCLKEFDDFERVFFGEESG